MGPGIDMILLATVLSTDVFVALKLNRKLKGRHRRVQIWANERNVSCYCWLIDSGVILDMLTRSKSTAIEVAMWMLPGQARKGRLCTISYLETRENA